jgi:hypothetical protein
MCHLYCLINETDVVVPSNLTHVSINIKGAEKR